MRIFKFAAVGLSGVLVNIGLLWLLTEALGIFYLISAAIAVEASIITNFLLNDFWTFKDRKGGKIYVRAMKFNAISACSMAMNLAVLFMLTEYAGLYYIYSELAGIAAAFIFNYDLNLNFTWGEKK